MVTIGNEMAPDGESGVVWALLSQLADVALERPTAMTVLERLCLAAILGVGCLVLPFRAGAADDCTRQCRREAVDCVATRCAGLSGDQRRACRETCRGVKGCARIRTLAYVVAECRTTPQGRTGRQRLMIRRGNCPPTTVMELPFDDPMPDLGLCRLWGESRMGHASVLVGGFQRLVVSPDGRAVVFEVTDDVALIPPSPAVPPELEGIYWVKADGTGLRRLAPASRYPRWVAVPNPAGPLFGLSPTIQIQARISPNGRLLAYTDLGPGPDGVEAPQVFVLDIASGARKQLTSLAKPIAPSGLGGFGLNCCTFMTNTSISFWHKAGSAPSRQFVINSDGSGVRELPSGTAIPGAEIVENFRVVGAGRVATTDLLMGDGSRELAVVFGSHLLQLTNFHRRDLFSQEVSPNGRRIFFLMSADPFGTNPSGNCQIFSIGVWGTGLKQLTHFREAERAIAGCGSWLQRGSGCTIYLAFLDPKTAELVFYSTCDPFGANPAGAQLFAMRSDGSHLRQLTSTRGLVVHDDGSVAAELPGPYWYTSRW